MDRAPGPSDTVGLFPSLHSDGRCDSSAQQQRNTRGQTRESPGEPEPLCAFNIK